MGVMPQPGEAYISRKTPAWSQRLCVRLEDDPESGRPRAAICGHSVVQNLWEGAFVAGHKDCVVEQVVQSLHPYGKARGLTDDPRQHGSAARGGEGDEVAS